ncbi:MAG: superoxide dismutase [Bacteroidales bacterium]|jgi:Fe-Mn family superoxide dismutase|nr:superoxide dismutase [Bacteroidales bacterium]
MTDIIKLPYEETALEGIISAKTLDFHYGKHYAGYVTNLNKLIEGTALADKDLAYIVKNSEGATYNNAAQSWNHAFYFQQFTAPHQSEPVGALAEAIKKQWRDFETFKQKFSEAAVGLFGAGWAWLSKDSKGELVITQESNAGNPMLKNLTPIMTFDVWEHAYYLDYQNKRADHVAALWKIINWETIDARYCK